MDSKKRSCGTLNAWLNRQAKTSSSASLVKVEPISIEESSTSIPKVEFNRSNEIQTNVVSNLSPEISGTSKVSSNFSIDIGDYLEDKIITDFSKAKLLQLSNIPDNDFIYPHSIHNKKGKEEKRFLKKVHFE